MTDSGKFRILIFITTVLTVLILSFNMFEEYFMAGIGDYLKRRVYYEKVILKKGLSLHRGMYWKEKE
ncbi:MAG: hypothetical protein HY754_01910 [Nitrospirae bacterium]|nr:hypothetical protein [Nitrospirota bacterium]